MMMAKKVIHEPKKLQRFDSATHFSVNQPTKDTENVSGNLLSLHGCEPKFDDLQIGQDLVSLIMKNGALDQFLLGGFPGTNFQANVASGLARLAAACDKSSSTDPWKLTAYLSNAENRALAALIAKVMLSKNAEMMGNRDEDITPERTVPTISQKSDQEKEGGDDEDEQHQHYHGDLSPSYMPKPPTTKPIREAKNRPQKRKTLRQPGTRPPLPFSKFLPDSTKGPGFSSPTA